MIHFNNITADGNCDYLWTTPFNIVMTVIYVTIFILAILGNGLVCFMQRSTRQMDIAANYFIVNLAVGDILMAIFCVPFSFVSMLVLRSWPLGRFMCKLVHYSQAVCVLVSTYTHLAIAVDRYLMITRPLHRRMGKKAAKLVICLVWCGSLAMALPLLIVSNVDQPTSWHQACELFACIEKWETSRHSLYYSYAFLILQFALPLTALIFSYGRIAYIVWGFRPPGEPVHVRDMRIQRSKRKMIKMMITLVVVFTASWLPLNVFVVFLKTHDDDDKWPRWLGMGMSEIPYMWIICHCLAMSHCCYNPIVYIYMSEKYRNGFSKVLNKFRPFNNNNAGDRQRVRLFVCEEIPLQPI